MFHWTEFQLVILRTITLILYNYRLEAKLCVTSMPYGEKAAATLANKLNLKPQKTKIQVPR